MQIFCRENLFSLLCYYVSICITVDFNNVKVYDSGCRAKNEEHTLVYKDKNM